MPCGVSSQHGFRAQGQAWWGVVRGLQCALQLSRAGSSTSSPNCLALDPCSHVVYDTTQLCAGALSLLCGAVLRGCPVYADEAALEPWTRCGLFRGGLPHNCTATWAERCSLSVRSPSDVSMSIALAALRDEEEAAVAHAAIAARLFTVTPHGDDACAVAPTELGVRLHTWLQAPSRLNRSAKAAAEKKTRLACEVRVCVP